MTERRLSEWLAQNSYVVAGGLAVACMMVVAAIALFDQLTGTERWCYRWLDADGDAHTTCRDGERACAFDRSRHCKGDPDAVASRCQPTGDDVSALERCPP